MADCSPIIKKINDRLNHYSNRLGAYIKDGFHFGRETKNENSDLPYMFFRVTLIHNSTFVFTLYRLRIKRKPKGY